MLSHDSKWRIDLARQIASRYNATAAILVGSPAYGLADAYSDVDILFYWETIPPLADRVAIAENMGGTIREIDPPTQKDPALIHESEVFHLGEHDLKIDITHKTIASQQQLIDDVVIRHEAHDYKMGALYGLSYVKTFSGHAIIDEWLSKIYPMTDALKRKLMKQYAHLWAHNVLQVLLIDRDDVLFANRLINDLCEKVVYMLMIVDGQYPPLRLKHINGIITSLSLKPMKLKERITQICSASPTEALPIAVQLVEDTFDIVETQGYDISNARKHFKIERKPNYQEIKINKETINNA